MDLSNCSCDHYCLLLSSDLITLWLNCVKMPHVSFSAVFPTCHYYNKCHTMASAVSSYITQPGSSDVNFTNHMEHLHGGEIFQNHMAKLTAPYANSQIFLLLSFHLQVWFPVLLKWSSHWSCSYFCTNYSLKKKQLILSLCCPSVVCAVIECVAWEL